MGYAFFSFWDILLVYAVSINAFNNILQKKKKNTTLNFGYAVMHTLVFKVDRGCNDHPE